MAPVDAHAEVLEQSHLSARPAAVPVVGGQVDEVEVVDDRQGAREVGDEDERRLQRGDEDWLEAVVVSGDLRSELPDPGLDLLPREVDLADALVDGS
jgi:hypothetical protein